MVHKVEPSKLSLMLQVGQVTLQTGSIGKFEFVCK